MTFKGQLLKLRRENNLSQEELAEKLGVSRQAISKWETGTASPELANLQALCELFGVSPNEMLGYETGSSIAPEPSDKTLPQWCKVLFIILAGFFLVSTIPKLMLITAYFSYKYDDDSVVTGQHSSAQAFDAEFISVDSMGSSLYVHNFRLVFGTEHPYDEENVFISVYDRDNGETKEHDVKKNGPYFVAEIPIRFRSNVIISACYSIDGKTVTGRELIQIRDVTENGYSYDLK